MAEPKVVAEVDGWKLTRCDYDGCPLEAERGDWNLCFDLDGDLLIEFSCTLSERTYVPASVLRQLLADYDERSAQLRAEEKKNG